MLFVFDEIGVSRMSAWNFLRGGGLLALAVFLLAFVPATATAAVQTIPGSGVGPSGHNLTIYVGDNGALQAKAGAPGDSVQGMFFGSDNGPAANYWHLRLKGAPAANTTFSNYDAEVVPVSNGPVTGNFTPSSPAQNVTINNIVHQGTTLFQIKQTVLYTAFSQRFRVVWEITNQTAGQTLPFIFGTSADLYIDSSDSGRGVFIDGPSRFVGGTNDQSRSTGGLQEVTASSLPGEASPTAIPRWASYEEGGYSSVVSRLEGADSFLNTIDPNLIDNGAGVSFANRSLQADGLAPGQTQRYEVIWHANRPTPLSATPAAASAELPDQHEVTLSLVDTNFNAVPNQRINYEITGANPSAAATAQTGATGQVVVSWTGANPGLDTLTAYADADGDGTRDPEEPAASATMRWLADNHVAGAPEVPANLSGPNGQLPVQVQQNPDNSEAPNYIFGRSASAAAGFSDCVFDQRSGRQLGLPVTVNLQPGAGVISNVSLALTDPARHTPTNLSSSLPIADGSPSVNGNAYSFLVDCVVPGEMWVEFTITEGGSSQVFRIPIGGLLLIDPQGVVYDGAVYDQAIASGQSPEAARATAAITGATVRLQRFVGGEFRNVLSGDPGITPNINPQTTAANGLFQWDVQVGTYRVSVTATGGQDAVSPAVDIPPPVLDLHMRMACGATAPRPEPDPADRLAPQTKIDKAPRARSSKTTVAFEFSANEAARFECKLEGKKVKKGLDEFSSCSSPRKYKKLKPGKYTFAVRATDTAGNVDGTPASQKFVVTKKKPKKKK